MLSFTDLYLMEMARMPHKMGEDDQKYMDSTKEDIAAKAKKCRSTNTPFVVTLKPGFPTKQAKARIRDIVREAAIKIREHGLPQHYVLKNEGNNTAILIDGDRDNYRTVSAPIAHEFITKGAQCPGAIKYTGNPSDVQLLKQVTGKDDANSGNAPSMPTAPPSPVIPPPSAPVTPASTVKRRGRPAKNTIASTVAKTQSISPSSSNTSFSMNVENDRKIEAELKNVVSSSVPNTGSVRSEFITTITDVFPATIEVDADIIRQFKQRLLTKILATRPDYVSIVKNVNNIKEKFILKLVGNNYSDKTAISNDILKFFDGVFYQDTNTNSPRKVRVLWNVSEPSIIGNMKNVMVVRDIAADAKIEFEKQEGINTSASTTTNAANKPTITIPVKDNVEEQNFINSIINSASLVGARKDELRIVIPSNVPDEMVMYEDNLDALYSWIESTNKKYPTMRYLSIVKPIGETKIAKLVLFNHYNGKQTREWRIIRFLNSLIYTKRGRGRSKKITVYWAEKPDKVFYQWGGIDNAIAVGTTNLNEDPAILFQHNDVLNTGISSPVPDINATDYPDTVVHDQKDNLDFISKHGSFTSPNAPTVSNLGTNSSNDARVATNSLDYGNQLASIHHTYSYNDNSKELSFFIPSLPEQGVTVGIRQVQNVHDNIVAVTKEKLPLFVSLVDSASGTKTVILYGRLDDGMLAGGRNRDFHDIVSSILKPMPPRSWNVVMAFDIAPARIMKKYGDKIAENVSMNANARDFFDDKFFVGSRFEAPSSSNSNMTSTNQRATSVDEYVQQLVDITAKSELNKEELKFRIPRRPEPFAYVKPHNYDVASISFGIVRESMQANVKFVSLVNMESPEVKTVIDVSGFTDNSRKKDALHTCITRMIRPSSNNPAEEQCLVFVDNYVPPTVLKKWKAENLRVYNVPVDTPLGANQNNSNAIDSTSAGSSEDDLKKAAMDVLSAMATKPTDTSVFNAPSASDLPTSNVAASLPPIPADVQLTIGKDEINKYIEMGKNNKVKRFVPKEMYGRIEGMQKLPGGSIRDCIKSIGSLFGGMDDTFLSLMKYYIDCYEATKDEKYVGAIAELAKQYGFNETQFNRLHDGIRQLQEIETFLQAIDYSFKSSII